MPLHVSDDFSFPDFHLVHVRSRKFAIGNSLRLFLRYGKFFLAPESDLIDMDNEHDLRGYELAKTGDHGPATGYNADTESRHGIPFAGNVRDIGSPSPAAAAASR